MGLISFTCAVGVPSYNLLISLFEWNVKWIKFRDDF